MYSLYNLVAKGDTVLASTTRNVVSESSTGSVRKKGVRVRLIRVSSANSTF
jgi:stalled ribosome rescue protein Dom34